MDTELKGRLESIGIADARTLMMKAVSYGDSWRKRGGSQAFAVFARKWDRIENIAKRKNYDIFSVFADNDGDVQDDIADLRRYLMLLEEYCTRVEDSTNE